MGVGACVGGSGGVAQLASAGLNGVADGVGDGVAVALGDALAAGLAEALAVAELVGVAAAVGVTTYGVYEGHGSRVAEGGAWAPAITREMATAIAPTSTVTTKVIAPHSRRNELMRRPSPARR